MVITIIALLAGMALPHMGGMTKAHSMTVATRQMLDDFALARQKALSTRSSVYIVFLSDSFLTDVDPKTKTSNRAQYDALALMKNATNRVGALANNQLRAYALVSLRSVGDQPGHDHAKYLTDWKILPQGVFIPTNKFNFDTVVTNVIPNVTISRFEFTNTIPFPTADFGKKFYLPYIKFNAQGQLASGKNEYIPLTSGSVLLAPDMWADPMITETPPGASTNNYNLIAIDWLTGRAKLVRKEIQ